MLFSAQHLASLAAVVELAHAHGFVNLIKTGGKFYPGFDLQYAYQTPRPKVAGWETTALDSGFVMPDAFQTGDIVCHRGGLPAQAYVPVVAGDTVQLYWNTWPEGHKGPVLDYLAACANNDCTTVDKTKLSFAKLDEVGFNAGSWGTDSLVANNNSWVVTIPKSLKNGAYVLRHEIISLHSARSDNGAQAYPQCVNLMVSGGGSTVPSGEPATSFYSRTDPGILIDIYQGLKSYIIPGPAVGLSGGGSGGSSPTSAAPGTTLVTSTKSATTVATTATSAKPTTSASSGGAGAPLYGQCGGTGWTGPTTCASGTCKASGSYYSQCLP